MSKITVLGGGGWAIALAMVLNDNGHNVTIWSAVNREVEALKTHRENKISLPGVIIPETVEITNDLKSAVKWSRNYCYGSCIFICKKYFKTFKGFDSKWSDYCRCC